MPLLSCTLTVEGKLLSSVPQKYLHSFAGMWPRKIWNRGINIHKIGCYLTKKGLAYFCPVMCYMEAEQKAFMEPLWILCWILLCWILLCWILCWYNWTWNQIAYLCLASHCMFASAAKSNYCMLVRWQHYNGGTESSQLRHFSGTFTYIHNWHNFPSFASHCLFLPVFWLALGDTSPCHFSLMQYLYL